MLEDRDYMRQPPFESRRSVTVILVIVNVVAFLVQSASYFMFQAALPDLPPPTDHLFALSLDGLKLDHYFWQLITFQFMHAGLLHVFCNLLGVWFFGRFIEQRLGGKNFLKIY